MNKILHLIMLCLCMLPANAQNKDAKGVLDATAAKMKQGTVKATFKAEQFHGNTPQGEASGTIHFKGNKFQITTPDMMTWYNGTTQWTYVKANQEVNVCTPTEEEQQGLNPYAFVNLYKKGYKFGMKETTLRGKSCYEITMKATDRKRELNTIIVNVEKGSYTPMCIRMKRTSTGEWNRIVIYTFQAGNPSADTNFEFNPKDFPKAEIIDLR